jgi:hypothetical protein
MDRTLIESVLVGVNELNDKSLAEARAITEAMILPPSLPAGDGRSIWITREGRRAVWKLAQQWRQSSKYQARTSDSEADKLLAETIGRALIGQKIDVERACFAPTALAAKLDEQIEARILDIEFSFRVRLFNHHKSDHFVIGPISFETGQVWDDRVRDPENSMMDIVDRRKFSSTPWIASVWSKGRTHDRAHDHAKACIRLGMDALCLPLSISQAREVRSPADAYDEARREWVSRLPNHRMGWSGSRDVFGLRSPADAVEEFLAANRLYLDEVGTSIQSVVSDREHPTHPMLRRRWQEALHWIGEARRAADDFVALVQLGIGLDVLAGGRRGGGIERLIAKLEGVAPEETYTTDGRSVRQLVKQLYNDGRSRLAHGSRFGLLEDLPLSRADADRLAANALMSFVMALRTYEGPDDPHAFSAPAG